MLFPPDNHNLHRVQRLAASDRQYGRSARGRSIVAKWLPVSGTRSVSAGQSRYFVLGEYIPPVVDDSWSSFWPSLSLSVLFVCFCVLCALDSSRKLCS